MAFYSIKTKDTIIASVKPYFRNGKKMQQTVYLTPFGKTPEGKTRYRSVTKHESANS